MLSPFMANRIEHWPLDKLIPYACNAHTHSAQQVAEIANSIREFGFNSPILVDSHAGIIAGHGRLLAARQLNLAEVPIHRSVPRQESPENETRRARKHAVGVKRGRKR